MTKFKKVLLASTATVMTVALAIGGTMAYLTSQDSDVNVMTLGNVKIEQLEYERVMDADGNPVLGVEGEDFESDYEITQSYKLQEFTQDKPAYPAVYTNGDMGWDEFQQLWNQVGAPGSNDLFDDSMKNVVDKFVFVKNTGKSDAYYRTVVAVEQPEGVGDEMIHVNYTTNSRFDVEKIGYTVIDGVRYYLYEMLYKEILKPGEVSRPSLLQVYLDPLATNEDCEKFGDTWEILVKTEAVQAAGFTSASNARSAEKCAAEVALDTAFYDVTTEQHPWNEVAFSEDAEGLVEALENGQDVVLTKNIKIDPAKMSNAYGKTGINVKNGQTIDGAGHTLDIKGAGGTWDSGINTTGGTIKDVKVTGSFRGIFINHTSTHSEPVVLENVTIDGTVYTISCDQGMNQNLIAKNSTFNGWTSYAATLGNATFIDCNFGEGRGYAYCRPYAPTTFVGCDFEAGFEMDAVAAVTFENCTIGGVKLTASNLATLVTSNIANATVK